MTRKIYAKWNLYISMKISCCSKPDMGLRVHRAVEMVQISENSRFRILSTRVLYWNTGGSGMTCGISQCCCPVRKRLYRRRDRNRNRAPLKCFYYFVRRRVFLSSSIRRRNRRIHFERTSVNKRHRLYGDGNGASRKRHRYSDTRLVFISPKVSLGQNTTLYLITSVRL